MSEKAYARFISCFPDVEDLSDKLNGLEDGKSLIKVWNYMFDDNIEITENADENATKLCEKIRTTKYKIQPINKSFNREQLNTIIRILYLLIDESPKSAEIQEKVAALGVSVTIFLKKINPTMINVEQEADTPRKSREQGSSDKEKEIEKLKQEIEEAEQKLQQLEMLKKDRENIQISIDTTEKLITRVEKDSEKLQKDLEDQQRDYNEIQQEITSIKNEIHESDPKNIEIKNHLKEVDKYKDVLQEFRVYKSKAAEIQEIQNEIDKYKKENQAILNKINANKENLQTAIELDYKYEVDQDIEPAEVKEDVGLNELLTMITELQIEMFEADFHYNPRLNYDEEKIRLEKQIEELEATKAELQLKVDDVNKQREQIQAVMKSIADNAENANENINDIISYIHAKNQEITTLATISTLLKKKNAKKTLNINYRNYIYNTN